MEGGACLEQGMKIVFRVRELTSSGRLPNNSETNKNSDDSISVNAEPVKDSHSGGGREMKGSNYVLQLSTIMSLLFLFFLCHF